MKKEKYISRPTISNGPCFFYETQVLFDATIKIALRHDTIPRSILARVDGVVFIARQRMQKTYFEIIEGEGRAYLIIIAV